MITCDVVSASWAVLHELIAIKILLLTSNTMLCCYVLHSSSSVAVGNVFQTQIIPLVKNVTMLFVR